MDLNELVMNTVISNPFNHVILRRQSLHQHQHNPHWKICFKCSMSPISMSSNSRSIARDESHNPTKDDCRCLLLEAEPVDCRNVKENKENHIFPSDVVFVINVVFRETRT